MNATRVLKGVAVSLALVVALLLGLIGWQQQRTQPQVPPLRVLFIGNSYTFTEDMPALLSALASADDDPRALKVESVALPGFTLAQHLQDGSALQRIKAEQWDYVVLQEQSLTPLENPSGMQAALQTFDHVIKRQGATTLLFLTWSREFAPATQAQISQVYRRQAQRLGAQVAPVGEAWQQARTLDPAIALYSADGSHPSRRGAYLSACVFYATLLQRSPVGLPALKVADQQTVQLLQQAAWAVAAPRS